MRPTARGPADPTSASWPDLHHNCRLASWDHRHFTVSNHTIQLHTGQKMSRWHACTHGWIATHPMGIGGIKICFFLPCCIHKCQYINISVLSASDGVSMGFSKRRFQWIEDIGQRVSKHFVGNRLSLVVLQRAVKQVAENSETRPECG